MEKNIFEGAKFGDKFITRDGYVSIFLGVDSSSKDLHLNYEFVCQINNRFYQYCVDSLDGNSYGFYDGKYDIVSRYQESINEDALNELAEENIPKFYDEDDEWIEPFTYGFKYGYKLAKEK